MKKKKIFPQIFTYLWKKIVLLSGINKSARIGLVVVVSVLLGNIYPTEVKAQSLNQTITFEVKNQSLDRALQQLNRMPGVKIAYSVQQVSKYTSVSVEKGTRTVDATLSLLLERTNLTYTMKANSILLIERPQKSVNKRRITGTVFDRNNVKIPGVTIRAEGANVGTVSDAHGEYTIEVPEQAVLVYSCIGMIPQREHVGNRSVIHVQLEEDAIMLKSVEIVSTGYQRLPAERATGAFGRISSEDLKKTPAVNIMEKLEGSTPGVNFDVRTNTIRIRGVNSFQTTDAVSPLVVIDGFPAIDQSLASSVSTLGSAGAILSRLNAEDIESITILKDAAATSIWGAKAANGVIVIETKKGKRGATSISFSTNLSISAPADLNKLDRMSSADYIDLEKELKTNGFITDPTKFTGTLNTNKPVSDALDWMFSADRGTVTAAARDAALAKLSQNNNNDQIKKYLLQNAVSQQYNLSLSGGGATNTYYISSNYTKDVPVFRSNQADNYFLTGNFSNSFLDDRINLKIGMNYNYSYGKSNSAALNALGSTNYGLRPYDMLVDEDGNRIQRSVDLLGSVVDNLASKGYMSWRYNPIDELNYSNSTRKDNRLRVTVSLDGKINNWLSASVSGSIQKLNGTTDILDDQDSYIMRNSINKATTISSAGKLVYGIPYGGRLITSYNQKDDKSFRGQFNVNKTWGGVATLNFLGGAEIRESQGVKYQQTRYGLDPDTYMAKSYDPSVSYMTIYGWTSTIGYNDSQVSKSINRFLSYYSNAALSFFNGKYLLSGSVRFDDYTLAGYSQSQRARPLWSVGAKWKPKQEKFTEFLNFMSDLSIRGSVGIAGTIPSGGSNVAIMTISGNDRLTNETYGSILTPADSRVSWETTTNYNLGIDWGILKNRIKGTIDLYYKNTKDILYSLPVNPTYGWISLQKNGATMKGHGFDIGLTAKIIETKDWNWLSNLNVSYNTNEVTDSRFAKPTSYSVVGGSTPLVGKSLDYMYAYRWAGLDNTGQSQIYLQDGTILKSTDNSKTVTSEDLKYMGRTTAPYFGGFQNSVQYKHITLSANITYAFGHIFRRQSVNNYPQYKGTFSGVIGAQKDLALRWKNPGDESTTDVPGLVAINYNSYSRYQYADILVESASNIKLRQIALTYSVPSALLQKTIFKSLNAGISVRNLGMLWVANKEKIDPDYVMTNNYTNLPPARTYYFTLNMTF